MRFLLTLVGAAFALLALGIADVALDDSRFLYMLMGRDGLVAACLPVLTQDLMDEGFEPNDVQFGPRPSINFGWGKGRTFEAPFSFEDGSAATRIDGIASCRVAPSGIDVKLTTDQKPVRAT